MSVQSSMHAAQAQDEIFSAKKISWLRAGRASRDISKPRNVAAAFVKGGRYQIHASLTSGRMINMVWIYERGCLVHTARDATICDRVRAAYRTR